MTTAPTSQHALDTLNAKIQGMLSDRVILKPLTRWNEAYKEFPRYVMEYLVSRYVQPADPVAGQEKIDRILTEHYAESAKKELIKSRIKEKGQYTLLGQFSVRLDQGRDHYWADVPALGDNTVRVAPKVLEEYGEVLLTSGAWGTMELEYDGTYEIKGKKYPFYVRAFTPLQYTRLDVDDYISKRPEFTEDEWLDLLIQSIGFNPTKFDRRVKLLMMLRLVPFVESNYNLIELGPRETGKTYTFRNTSNRGFVISGGGANATPANLFYNRNTRKLGVMGSMTGRNQDAVKKTVAGMLKLLHPHRAHDELTEEEISPLVEFAVEMRRRTTDQLAKLLPSEFSNVNYSYKLGQHG